MGPLAAVVLLAGAVESFQVSAYNETQVEGRSLVYDETDVWLQKSWQTFDRSTKAVYAGVESLVEPADQAPTLARDDSPTEAVEIALRNDLPEPGLARPTGFDPAISLARMPAIPS